MGESDTKDPFPSSSPVDQPIANNHPLVVPNANMSVTAPSAQNVQQDFNVQAPISTIPPTVVPAGIRLRFSAAFFDGLIFNAPIGLIYALLMFLGVDLLSISGVANLFLFIIFIAATIGYFVYFHTQKGATPGKAIYGLQVVDFNTKNKISTGKAITREGVVRGIGSLPLIGFIFSIANFFAILSSPEKRGIHDKAAGSQVLITRKSWPLLKQIGLFILLIGITLMPYIFLIPKFASNTGEVNKCVLECIETQNYNNENVVEFQRITQFCNQKCLN